MARLYFLIAVAALVAVAFAEPEPIGVQVVDDINKFRAENPRVRLMPFAIQPRQNFHFVLGNKYPGDRLLTQGNNNLNYPTLQDVQIKLNYPQNGVGSNIITFVEVYVDQSSNINNIYVVSGGIGQRQITILIEAKRTAFLNYRAAFWGR